MSDDLKEMLQSILKDALDPINKRLDNIEINMATKQDVQEIKQKLDTIYAQVAHNTEQEVKLNDVTDKVLNLETDIKLIKRMLTS